MGNFHIDHDLDWINIRGFKTLAFYMDIITKLVIPGRPTVFLP